MSAELPQEATAIYKDARDPKNTSRWKIADGRVWWMDERTAWTESVLSLHEMPGEGGVFMLDEATAPAEPAPLDEFRGDNGQLRESIKALIELSDRGALVPHGLGGHSRALLAAAYNRLKP